MKGCLEKDTVRKRYVAGWIETKGGTVPRVTTRLTLFDIWGATKARLGINRMNYKVIPGLYTVGEPTEDSVVLVSANYKLSFDMLRKELAGIDAWILVLDTQGINVWCAAGNRDFGTEEIVRRIEITELQKIVHHRELIVPQLGAPGVSAHQVKELSGFSVIYGPVRADDIVPFLKADMKTTPEMRSITFSFYDRLRLVPIEFIIGFKPYILLCLIFFLLSGLNKNGYSFELLLTDGLRGVYNLLFSYVAGTIVAPLFLPYIPGRAFSIKGSLTGIVLVIALFFAGSCGENIFEIISWFSLIPALTSFLTMNFTGASTYTSLSGVLKEVRIAFPLQTAFFIIGSGLWLAGRFF